MTEKKPPNHVDDGSSPLRSNRHEAFCVHVAAGGALGPSWTRASLDSGAAISNNANAAKATAFKLSRQPHIAARILYLKGERDAAAKKIDLPETLTKADVAALADECITALEDTYKRCLDDPSATAPQRERLLQTLSRHLARTAKYTDNDTEVGDDEGTRVSRRMTDRLLAWHECTCGGRHV